MPKSQSKSRNVTILFSTIALLAITAFGYFYLYTQQREEDLNARNIRVLDQISDNILSLNNTYRQNAQNNATQDISQLEREALFFFNRRIDGYNSEIRAEVRKLLQLPKGNPWFGLDTINFIRYLNESELTFRKKTRDFKVNEKAPFCPNQRTSNQFIDAQIEKGFALFKSSKTTSQLPPSNKPEIDSIITSRIKIINEKIEQKLDLICRDSVPFIDFQREYKEKNNLNYDIIEFKEGADFEPEPYLQVAPQGWEIVYTDSIKSSGSLGFRLTRPVSDLLSKVLRQDIFDEMIIYRKQPADSTIAPGTDEFISIYQTLEDNFTSRQLQQQIDSLLKKQLDAGERHTLPKIPYQLYIKPLQLPKERNLYICGLVSQDKFAVERAQIPTTLILFLVIIAMLLVLSIPFLKLRLIGKHERLGIADVVFSLASLILGTWLLVLLLVNIYRVYGQDSLTRNE